MRLSIGGGRLPFAFEQPQGRVAGSRRQGSCRCWRNAQASECAEVFSVRDIEGALGGGLEETPAASSTGQEMKSYRHERIEDAVGKDR
jgi:hypothetical protein